MKPRIRIRFGIWQCASPLVIGYGYSPRDAYAEWEMLDAVFHGKRIHG